MTAAHDAAQEREGRSALAKFNEQRMPDFQVASSTDWKRVAFQAMAERDRAESFLQIWIDFAANLAKPHLCISDVERFIAEQKRKHQELVKHRRALDGGSDD